MQLKEIGNWKLSDASLVVKEFELEEVFEKEYGVPVDDFEYNDIGEVTVVEKLLDDISDRLFYSTFIETGDSDGYYHIVEFENTQIPAQTGEMPIIHVYQRSFGGILDEPEISTTGESFQKIMQAALEEFKESYPTYYKEYISVDDDGTIYYVGKDDKEEHRYWTIVPNSNEVIENHLKKEDLLPYDGKILDIKDQQFTMACHHNSRINTILWKNKDYLIYATPYDYGTAGLNFELFLQENGVLADDKRYKKNITTPDEYFTIVTDYISKLLDNKK